ncbi:MAG TPA: TA system VapC family ribonuclease toxin [Thermoanaerobaculia bacterium]|nr:TA system VapC family ribonuclease toxin [Thermoanaerobaculia bacterium]
MRAIDTNILVYSEIVSSTYHHAARRLLTSMAEGPAPWAIPWPCVYEFLRVITHPRVFSPPVPRAVALHDLGQIFSSPTLRLLSETERHVEVMQTVVSESDATGNLVHDAHIAALCIEHGVSELFTGDRDFSRFRLHVTNPFR